MTSQIPNPMPQGARPYHKMREQKLTSRSETVAFVIILRVDRFMSEARALTNLIGNGVATFVVSKWEDAVDERRMREDLDHETDLEADTPEQTNFQCTIRRSNSSFCGNPGSDQSPK